MKKILLSAVLFIGLSALGTANAQSSENLGDLKAKKEVLKLNTKLNNYKIKLEKERKAFEKYQNEVNDANKEAEKKGSDFSGSSNAGDTAKEAKAAAKKMKAAQKANKNLASSKKKIEDLEKGIKKAEDRIAKLNQQIEFTDKKAKKAKESESTEENTEKKD